MLPALSTEAAAAVPSLLSQSQPRSGSRGKRYRPEGPPCLPASSPPGPRDITCGLHLRRRAPDRVTAFAGRGRGRVDEDEVEFDDWDSSGQRPSTVSGTAQQVWSVVNSFADRAVDLAMDFAPDTLSRSVVETIVKAGLALGAIILVRGILGSIVLFGTVILALYVGTRVLGLDGGEKAGQRPGGERPFRRQKPQASWKGLPSGKAAGDLMDVWFEPKKSQPSNVRRQK